ncbi:MAG: hypothetical protein BWK76_11890 [Desulfobulbaceae bacterium A2]|nr:MAG: hypothetical protein BWK76_11890 [Desulfobulbaceae bacterium A2]
MGERNTRDLEGIEGEAREQENQGEELKKEIDLHKEQVSKLEETLNELRAQAGELKSNDLAAAIGNAELARRGAQDRITQALEKRDQLLQQNEEMTQRVDKAYEKRKQTQGKVNFLQFGATGEVAKSMQGIMDALNQDMNKLASVSSELAHARKRLETLAD